MGFRYRFRLIQQLLEAAEGREIEAENFLFILAGTGGRHDTGVRRFRCLNKDRLRLGTYDGSVATPDIGQATAG